MADDPPQSPTRNRRSSFAGQTLADLFGTGRPSIGNRGQTENPSPPPQSNQGPITQAAAQAQQRRMSLTTLGLSGSPNQTSPFGSYRGARRGSISASTDESAIAEDDSPTQKEETGTSPTPFARRTSFGARALRDRMGSFGGSGGNTGQNGTRSPPASNRAQNGTISSKGRGPSGEGFNWSNNFRDRAERGSIAGPAPGPVGQPSAHARAKSVAVMEPPPTAAMPPPKQQTRPDHFQERILKGDFYMD